jgi:hypothetical protein
VDPSERLSGAESNHGSRSKARESPVSSGPRPVPYQRRRRPSVGLTAPLVGLVGIVSAPPLYSSGNFAGKWVDLLYGSQEDDYLRGRGAFAFGEDTGREEERQDLRGLQRPLRYYLEATGGPEASREERPGNGTYEEHQPWPRVPLLSGGKHPTLGERLEEELHRS